MSSNKPSAKGGKKNKSTWAKKIGRGALILSTSAAFALGGAIGTGVLLGQLSISPPAKRFIGEGAIVAASGGAVLGAVGGAALGGTLAWKATK